MQSRLATAVALFVILTAASQVPAQRLKNRRVIRPQVEVNTEGRRPNDEIEGMIWEYKSVEYKSSTKPGEPIPILDGRFRIEGTAVFDAKRAISVPSQNERQQLVQKLREGGEISMPEGLELKRIGEYKKLNDGRLRFDFNDPEGLHGIMIVWKKKDTNGVWLANYKQKEGSRTTGEWLMELRSIED